MAEREFLIIFGCVGFMGFWLGRMSIIGKQLCNWNRHGYCMREDK